MKIAYLVNTYPVTSATFIRREIHALERRGLTVDRYAVRSWANDLVDQQDLDEKARTHLLLSGNLFGLLVAVVKAVFTDPKSLGRGIRLWATLVRNARGLVVQHVAYLFEAVYLRQDTARNGVEHIHAHYSTNPTAVAMLCHAMGGPTYSFTAHGPDEFDAPEITSLGLKVANAAFVVAISDYCKTVLIRASSYEHWDKVKIIRCGLALDEFEALPPPPADNHTLVCVGRLCPQKGQLLLPKAVAELRTEFPDLRVVLVGDGESRPGIEAAMKKYGVEDAIELVGWATNERVREALADSRALILPSFAEGLPVVFMEAFAMHRPVIATYIAGIPELVDEECGWIVPAGDEVALTAAMRAALRAKPETLGRMAAEGRSRVEERHNLETLAESFAKNFEAVSSDPSGAQ